MVTQFMEKLKISGQIKTLLDKSVPTCYTITIQRKTMRVSKRKGDVNHVGENAEGILRVSCSVHSLR